MISWQYSCKETNRLSKMKLFIRKRADNQMNYALIVEGFAAAPLCFSGNVLKLK